MGAATHAAAVFGTTALVSEAISNDGGGDHRGGHGGGAVETRKENDMNTNPGHEQQSNEQDPVRGLAVAENGLKLELESAKLPRGRTVQLAFRVVGADGRAVGDFQVEHDKRMHLIIARRDLAGFQHLHPELGDDGRWTTPVTVPDAGSYRVFVDFRHGGENHTLAADLAVDGELDSWPLAPTRPTADAGGGYQVKLTGAQSKAGEEAELDFTVTRGAEQITAEDYLGAKGHLVALREGDLAYLHVHPAESGQDGKAEGDGGHASNDEASRGDAAPATAPIRFMTEFPSKGRYGLFLQFKHEGKVRTAAFTREVAR